MTTSGRQHGDKRNMLMRIILTIVSIVLLLLSIASFVTALISFKEPFEFLFPKLSNTVVKKAVGTVTNIYTSSTSSKSLQTGNSYSTSSKRVDIQFHDEKGRLYELSCNPIFKNFKEKSTIAVLYYTNSTFEKDADENMKEATSKGREKPLPTYVPGIPVSVFLWLERPAIFLVIAIVLLIIRFPVGQLKNTFP